MFTANQTTKKRLSKRKLFHPQRQNNNRFQKLDKLKVKTQNSSSKNLIVSDIRALRPWSHN